MSKQDQIYELPRLDCAVCRTTLTYYKTTPPPPAACRVFAVDDRCKYVVEAQIGTLAVEVDKEIARGALGLKTLYPGDKDDNQA